MSSVCIGSVVPQELCPGGSMVAFPKKKSSERREGYHAERNPRQNLQSVQRGAQGEVRDLLESLMHKAFLAFLRHPKPIRRYLYITNQLERLAKEVKRRTKVVEVFCGEGAVEKLLYLVLSHLDEVWGRRRLRRFMEIKMESYHVDHTHVTNLRSYQRDCTY